MRNLTVFALFAVTILLLASPAWCQATWEGPTGVFLNPLALTLAGGKTQLSGHFLDLNPAGSLSTWGATQGFGSTLEVGLTHADLSVEGGPSTDLNILHAKWVALPFKGEWPQVAVGAIVRDPSGGDATEDFYAVATKVFPGSTPIIASLTVRNTNGLGSGLFGKASSRTTEFGGFLGVQASPKIIAGIEYYEQPDVSPWQDIAVRYIAGPHTFIDLGYARLNAAFDDQIAVALTQQF